MKRVYLSLIRKYDLAHSTSYVREVEMELDLLNLPSGIHMQFIQDWHTYGLHEACVYLTGNLEMVRQIKAPVPVSYSTDGLFALRDKILSKVK